MQIKCKRQKNQNLYTAKEMRGSSEKNEKNIWKIELEEIGTKMRKIKVFQTTKRN